MDVPNHLKRRVRRSFTGNPRGPPGRSSCPLAEVRTQRAPPPHPDQSGFARGTPSRAARAHRPRPDWDISDASFSERSPLRRRPTRRSCDVAAPRGWVMRHGLQDELSPGVGSDEPFERRSSVESSSPEREARRTPPQGDVQGRSPSRTQADARPRSLAGRHGRTQRDRPGRQPGPPRRSGQSSPGRDRSTRAPRQGPTCAATACSCGCGFG